MIITCRGTIMVARRMLKSTSLPKNFSRAKAKPAREQVNRVPILAVSAT